MRTRFAALVLAGALGAALVVSPAQAGQSAHLTKHHRRITMVSGVLPSGGQPVPWNGSVYMNGDDFGECIIHVPIKIQRKHGSKWHTILTVHTEGVRPYGHNGGQSSFFKNGPHTKPGTFRAYMPKLRFGNDVCLPAQVISHWR